MFIANLIMWYLHIFLHLTFSMGPCTDEWTIQNHLHWYLSRVETVIGWHQILASSWLGKSGLYDLSLGFTLLAKYRTVSYHFISLALLPFFMTLCHHDFKFSFYIPSQKKKIKSNKKPLYHAKLCYIRWAF